MEEQFLRRYADLPAAIYLLKEKKITFLDPRSWDDRNDSHYLEVYKRQRDLNTLLAICFTQASETYHHWKVFASGPSGVCIKFKRPALLRSLKKQRGVKSGAVKRQIGVKSSMLTYVTNEDLTPKRSLPVLSRPLCY